MKNHIHNPSPIQMNTQSKHPLDTLTEIFKLLEVPEVIEGIDLGELGRRGKHAVQLLRAHNEHLTERYRVAIETVLQLEAQYAGLTSH